MTFTTSRHAILAGEYTRDTHRAPFDMEVPLIDAKHSFTFIRSAGRSA